MTSGWRPFVFDQELKRRARGDQKRFSLQIRIRYPSFPPKAFSIDNKRFMKPLTLSQSVIQRAIYPAILFDRHLIRGHHSTHVFLAWPSPLLIYGLYGNHSFLLSFDFNFFKVFSSRTLTHSYPELTTVAKISTLLGLALANTTLFPSHERRVYQGKK